MSGQPAAYFDPSPVMMRRPGKYSSIFTVVVFNESANIELGATVQREVYLQAIPVHLHHNIEYKFNALVGFTFTI
jgi:hypothetical protein